MRVYLFGYRSARRQFLLLTKHNAATASMGFGARLSTKTTGICLFFSLTS